MSDMHLTNHFLIAMPGIEDPRFHYVVTYICAHSQKGAIGIIINKPLNILLGEILQEVGRNLADEAINNIPVYHGGPVRTNEGFILYRDNKKDDGTSASSSKANAQINMATSLDISDIIGNGDHLANTFIALGYVGWSAGQLEQEMQDNAWLSVPVQPSIIFDMPVEQRWNVAVGLLGFNTNQLSSNVGHA